MMLVNGAPVDAVSSGDRGFHYGDGVFETFAVSAGCPLLWDGHMARLAEGCGRLGLPLQDRELLRREARHLCDGVSRGVLKLIVTRGDGARGYAPPAHPAPTRVFVTYPWPAHPPEYRAKGIATRLCTMRLGRNRTLAGIKHLNRLENVLARAECAESGLPEGLMLDSDGRLIGGTMSNVYLGVGDRLVTPALGHAGVAGVVRGFLLDAAGEGRLPLRVEADLTAADLQRADELFVSNSLIGVWPVVRIGDDWSRPVGHWARRAQALLAEADATLPATERN